ncbi:unnamed protein product [Lampetra fluviatilis]
MHADRRHIACAQRCHHLSQEAFDGAVSLASERADELQTSLDTEAFKRRERRMRRSRTGESVETSVGLSSALSLKITSEEQRRKNKCVSVSPSVAPCVPAWL